jgi:nucleoside-diphosphate-sugar epimerase
VGKVKILVIGGTGYIGRKLIDKLLSMKDSFIIHSTYYCNKGEFRENVIYFKCDLTNIESIKNTLTEDYDYVINLSGYVNHTLFSEGGISVINTHLIGLLNLTEILSRKNLKKFVQIGSSDEYGDDLNYKNEIKKENPISSSLNVANPPV